MPLENDIQALTAALLGLTAAINAKAAPGLVPNTIQASGPALTATVEPVTPKPVTPTTPPAPAPEPKPVKTPKAAAPKAEPAPAPKAETAEQAAAVTAKTETLPDLTPEILKAFMPLRKGRLAEATAILKTEGNGAASFASVPREYQQAVLDALTAATLAG
jgi:outer membrane biosynthesis protein TonB